MTPSRLRRSLPALTAAVALACSVLQMQAAQPAYAADSGRIAIGDSVMLGAKSALQHRGFDIVDADESRQASKGPALLHKRGSALPGNVVLHLGTNGTYPLDTCKEMVKMAGTGRNVFLVTIHAKRSWTKPNNAMLRKCAAAFPAGQVMVVDWDWAASRHPKWLYSDGIHLTPDGAAGFARVLDSAVDSAG